MINVTSGSVFIFVAAAVNQMWLTDYTSSGEAGNCSFQNPSFSITEMSTEAKHDAASHHSLLSSGLKVMRKMMMPISRTINSTIDVSRKARHAGLPVSWIRASLGPLAAP